MRTAAAAILVLLAACAAQSPSADEKPAATPAAADESSDTPTMREMEVGPKAAALAYMVAQHSPLLTEAQRGAISQNFNGAPINGEPLVHTVTADRVSCRARTESVGEGAACSIDFGAETKDLAGEDAQFLFDALGSAGVEAESGMSHLERTITRLSCTVDDAVAQGTSSSGDEINGFACRFTVDF